MENRFFSEYQQFRDWCELNKAIDAAPVIPPCTNYPEAWFPNFHEGDADSREARAMCKGCPVMNECAIYGIKWEKFGIWGGLGTRDREQIRINAKRKLPRKRKFA